MTQTFVGDFVFMALIGVVGGILLVAMDRVIKGHGKPGKIMVVIGIPSFISGLALASTLGGYAAIMLITGLFMSVLGLAWCTIHSEAKQKGNV